MGTSALQWSDEMSVGHPVLDEQHQLLVDLANRVKTLFGTDARAAIDAAFEEIVKYTIHHFKFEENVLRAAKYPGLNGHKKIHKKISDSVDDLYAHRDTVTPEQLYSTLYDVIIKHILVDDIKFKDILSAR